MSATKQRRRTQRLSVKGSMNPFCGLVPFAGLVPGSGLRLDGQCRVSQPDDIPAAEDDLVDSRAVHERAVGAAEIGIDEHTATRRDLPVMARDPFVGKDQLV